MTEQIDLEDVAAWCLRQRWFSTGAWDTDFRERKFHPKVLELYKEGRARELREEQRKKEQCERDERMWEEARVAREKAAHEAWLMKDMRSGGNSSGYFVGTRGRISRAVVEAYKKAKGL